MTDQHTSPTLPPLPSRANAGIPGVHEALDKVLAPAKKSRKRKAKKAKQLPAAEIKKLNAKRRKNQKQAAGTPANPNRPLEMKNKLNAVLELSSSLRKPQLVLFTELMQRLEGVPRGSRKRILEALGSVYK